MTIDELYKFVQYVANKEQRGFIKPSEFNLLAKRAQLDVIKQRVGKPSPADQSVGYKVTSALFDELYPVILLDVAVAYNNGALQFPDNYLYFLSATLGNSTLGRFVDIVSHGEWVSRMQSTLVAPSQNRPIGVIGDSGFRVFAPSEVTSGVRLSYVKSPADPVWNFTTVNDIEVYNATGSVQLTLPESTHMEIAHRILTYVSVNLRESEMVQYSTAIAKEN